MFRISSWVIFLGGLLLFAVSFNDGLWFRDHPRNADHRAPRRN